jgi:ketosteroid isomerase-like protein
MRIARLLVAAATAALTLTTTAEGQTRLSVQARDGAARLRTAVEASAARTAAAFNRGDIDGFIQPYAQEVWVFPPNAQPFQGPAAAHEYFTRDYMDSGTRNLQLTTTGLDRSGDLAYETGTYVADYPTPGGRAGAMSRDHGKYVQIWKRDPTGAWRVHLATWSSNLPPTPAPR